MKPNGDADNCFRKSEIDGGIPMSASEQANRSLKRIEALHRDGGSFADAQAPYEALRAVYALASEKVRAAVLDHYLQVAERLLADMQHGGKRDPGFRRS